MNKIKKTKKLESITVHCHKISIKPFRFVVLKNIQGKKTRISNISIDLHFGLFLTKRNFHGKLFLKKNQVFVKNSFSVFCLEQFVFLTDFLNALAWLH